MTTIHLLLVILFSGQVFSCEENCDDCCWQKCFSTPGIYSSEYARFHSLVEAIRAKKEEIGAGGTAFLFDQTTTGTNICLYQKNLASLIALTMPVSDVCNPFFLNRYGYNFAYYLWSWQCKNRCDAATTISNTPSCTPPPSIAPNWLNGGCRLANHAFNNPGLPCSKNTVKGREMVVALANSAFRMPPPSVFGWGWCLGFTRAVVGVEHAYVPQMNAFASSPFLAFDFKNMDGSNALAAIRQLLKCINVNCCNGTSNTPVKRQADRGSATIHIQGENPKTMSLEEVEKLIEGGIKPATTPTPKPPVPCKRKDKRCARNRGKCYKIKEKNCKYLGKCNKKTGCRYCLRC